MLCVYANERDRNVLYMSQNDCECEIQIFRLCMRKTLEYFVVFSFYSLLFALFLGLCCLSFLCRLRLVLVLYLARFIWYVQLHFEFVYSRWYSYQLFVLHRKSVCPRNEFTPFWRYSIIIISFLFICTIRINPLLLLIAKPENIQWRN